MLIFVGYRVYMLLSPFCFVCVCACVWFAAAGAVRHRAGPQALGRPACVGVRCRRRRRGRLRACVCAGAVGAGPRPQASVLAPASGGLCARVRVRAYTVYHITDAYPLHIQPQAPFHKCRHCRWPQLPSASPLCSAHSLPASSRSPRSQREWQAGGTATLPRSRRAEPRAARRLSISFGLHRSRWPRRSLRVRGCADSWPRPQTKEDSFSGS